MAKKIHVTSVFESSVDTIWDKLQQFETLQYIASPLLTFKTIDSSAFKWNEGLVIKLKIKLFGFIPIGIHTINILQINRERLMIYTNEGNKLVPIWNHKIILEEVGINKTKYSDEVEIYARWKTNLVCLLSSYFYKHRQKKWVKLLKNEISTK